MFIEYIQSLHESTEPIKQKLLSESAVDKIRSLYKIKKIVPNSSYLDVYLFDKIDIAKIRNLLGDIKFRVSTEENRVRLFDSGM